MNVIISIKPKYANAILDGSKLYEYRKRLPKNTDIKKVYIYASKVFRIPIMSSNQNLRSRGNCPPLSSGICKGFLLVTVAPLCRCRLRYPRSWRIMRHEKPRPVRGRGALLCFDCQLETVMHQTSLTAKSCLLISCNASSNCLNSARVK